MEVYTTGALAANLAGSADAGGQPITRISWENANINGSGTVTGTNSWAATVPLFGNKTNVVMITATTASWTPGYGGSTTFNNTIAVFSNPIQASLTAQGQGFVLNWSGGVGPFNVQSSTDLAGGKWESLITNAIPPITFYSGGRAEFYRVVGR